MSFSNLFVENIRLSELEGGKKQQILDLLSSAPSKDIQFEENEDDEILVTYRVSLPRMDMSKKRFMANKTPLREYVQSKQNASVLEKPYIPEEYRKKKKRKKSKNVRGILWTLKFIQEIYQSRYQLFSTEISSPDGKMESFTSYMFAHIQSKFGLKKIVKQNTNELLESVRFYSKKHEGIELFGLFFTPYYTVRDLMFYLHGMHTVAKLMYSKEKPQTIQRRTSFEIKIPYDRVKHFTKKILAHQPRVLKRNCFRRLNNKKEYTYRIIARRKRSSGVPGIGIYEITINRYLRILLGEYRKLASTFYTVLPHDVPYYHRIRDRSVMKYIILRSFKKKGSYFVNGVDMGIGGKWHGKNQPETTGPSYQSSVNDDQISSISTKFVKEEEIKEYMKRMNYKLSFNRERDEEMNEKDDDLEKRSIFTDSTAFTDNPIIGLLPTDNEITLDNMTKKGKKEIITEERVFRSLKEKEKDNEKRIEDDYEDEIDPTDEFRLPTYDDKIIRQEELFKKTNEPKKKKNDLLIEDIESGGEGDGMDDEKGEIMKAEIGGESDDDDDEEVDEIEDEDSESDSDDLIDEKLKEYLRNKWRKDGKRDIGVGNLNIKREEEEEEGELGEIDELIDLKTADDVLQELKKRKNEKESQTPPAKNFSSRKKKKRRTGGGVPNIYKMLMSDNDDEYKISSFHNLEDDNDDLLDNNTEDLNDFNMDEMEDVVKNLFGKEQMKPMKKKREPNIRENEKAKREEKEKEFGIREELKRELNLNSLMFKFTEPTD